MTQPFSSETFDIFSGEPDSNAMWCESAQGIDRARQRMRELADEKPGSYFIFHARTQIILDRIRAAKSGDKPDQADIAKAG